MKTLLLKPFTPVCFLKICILRKYITHYLFPELIIGKLDQKNSHLEIDFSSPRDIQEGNIEEITKTLSEWLETCESSINCLQEQIDTSKDQKEKRLKHKEQFEEQVCLLI